MATSTTKRDYYEVLGVARDADDKAIKNAFRRLALKYHPDRSKEPDAEARFKEIAEAYAVLSNPDKRADYDARGFAGVAGFSPEDLFAGVDFGDLFGSFGFDARGGSSSGCSTPAGGAGRSADIEVVLTIPLITVLTGGEETVTIARPGRCETCRGSGARAGTQPRSCEACGGSGQQAASSRQGNVFVQHVTTCTACSGRGTIIDDPCPDCGGTGEVTRHDNVKVQIPRGVDEGTALRIPGYGMAASGTRGAPADAYVIVETAPDPRFIRRGADLWHSEEIDVPDAVLGTTRQVATLDGRVSITIAPGTQPGTTLRIAGKGLPHFASNGMGDLHIALAVRIPEHVTDRDRRLWRRLRTSPSTQSRAGAA